MGPMPEVAPSAEARLCRDARRRCCSRPATSGPPLQADLLRALRRFRTCRRNTLRREPSFSASGIEPARDTVGGSIPLLKRSAGSIPAMPSCFMEHSMGWKELFRLSDIILNSPANHFPDPGGHGHCQSTPEGHAQCRFDDRCATDLRPNCSQDCQKAQRASGNRQWNE